MSSVLDMFRKGTKDGDLKKSVLKVSDPKKDALTRLKHLRHVLGNVANFQGGARRILDFSAPRRFGTAMFRHAL
jgi:hypothetical protein